jgi:hypothetical protein
MKHELSEHTKQLVDLASIVTVVGALVDFLPSVAALFTVIWTGIRIWETDTVQGWFKRK